MASFDFLAKKLTLIKMSNKIIESKSTLKILIQLM